MSDVRKRLLICMSTYALLQYAPAMAQASEGVINGTLQSHGVAVVPLPLVKGDYLRAQFSSDELLAEAKLLDPQGALFKQLLLYPAKKGLLQLSAEQSGEYQLVLTAAKVPARYAVNLQPVVAPVERVAVEKVPLSPSIRRLSESLLTDGDTDLFWQRMRQEGTPLVEEDKQRPGYSLVTFLWRGADRSVRLFGALPDSERHPHLERLGQSDVWYRTFSLPNSTRLSYKLVPDMPVLPDPEGKNRMAILATAQIDPLNKYPWIFSPKQDRFSTESTLTLPDAPKAPWLEQKNHPTGNTHTVSFYSDVLRNDREITVYHPPGTLKQDEPVPVLFFFDSNAYRSKVPTPAILDNLIAEKRIPPSIAVFIANASREARASELPCNPDFGKFMANELLPWVEEHIGFEPHASQTLLSGSSYGGLASACVAFQYPEKFGLVLSQSGSFWWGPEFRKVQDFKPEWVSRQYATEPVKPIRFYLTAGLFETGWQPSDILPSNRHLNDVLLAKGYRVTYREVAAGHDYFSWRATLADGLITLLGTPD